MLITYLQIQSRPANAQDGDRWQNEQTEPQAKRSMGVALIVAMGIRRNAIYQQGSTAKKVRVVRRNRITRSCKVVS